MWEPPVQTVFIHLMTVSGIWGFSDGKTPLTYFTLFRESPQLTRVTPPTSPSSLKSRFWKPLECRECCSHFIHCISFCTRRLVVWYQPAHCVFTWWNLTFWLAPFLFLSSFGPGRTNRKEHCLCAAVSSRALLHPQTQALLTVKIQCQSLVKINLICQSYEYEKSSEELLLQ